MGCEAATSRVVDPTEINGILFEIVKNAGSTVESDSSEGEGNCCQAVATTAPSGNLYLRRLELPSMSDPYLILEERIIKPMSPTDSNSQNDLLIDLTQLTLSSDCGVISSLSDHRSNTVRNKAGMWSVDNQSYTNPFDIQSMRFRG